MDKRQDHWGKKMIDFVAPYFQEATSTIHISTGFFTIQGYDLIRRYVEGKSVYVLVGYDETQNQNLRDKLIKDIMVHLGRWDGLNRRQAVEDLVAKLESGEFYIVEKGEPQFIEGRIRKDDHGKVYILDNSIVLIGSTNLTVNGLRGNDESQGVIDEPSRVEYWIKLFSEKWNAPDTYDLTQALLEALKNWLKLHIPYDVYLKTILSLIKLDSVPPPRPTYKIPSEYQQVIINRILRQLKKYRGAMLVASTGLGKTVMATHAAYQLLFDGRIGNILLFAPTSVHPDWEEALDKASLNHKIFTRQLLDANTKGEEGRKLSTAFEMIDEKYLIIVDESQYFRNEVRQQGDKRLSFTRLRDIVNAKNCLVLLLTATPLAKGVEDLNNQLMLLPHTAEPSNIRPDGQTFMKGFVDLPSNSWQVQDTENYFELFMKLPVSTVVSTSWVAKNFGITSSDGDYVDRPDGIGWLPRIEISKVRVPVPFEKEMSDCLTKGHFRHRWKTFQSRGEWKRSQTSIENLANIAWASSLLALQEVIYKTIAGEYDCEFIKSQEERASLLSPILEKLKKQSFEEDTKFMALCEIIRRHPNKKFIVFSERHETAFYLEQMFSKAMPDLHIANVVKQTTQGEYVLKDFEKEVLSLIIGFAPEANKGKVRKSGGRTYDVFISTDAYSMGVNLQDASIVINYDLAWTADTLIQRAGRILRFWTQPRQVHIYTFIGEYKFHTPMEKDSLQVEKRLQKLTQRTRQAEKFSELPIIPDTDNAQFISLGALSNVRIEDLGEIDITQIEEFSGGSPFLKHITELKQNIDYAESLPDDISSAILYQGKRHLIYLLLKYENKYYWTIYDILKMILTSIEEDALLDMITSTKQTPIANINVDLIEEQAQICKGLLCDAEGIKVLETERICALYLKPEKDADEIDIMLKSSVPVR